MPNEETGDVGSMEKYLLNLIKKAIAPVGETLEKLERITLELVTIKDNLRQLDLKIEHLTIRSQSAQINKEVVTSREIERLAKELEASREQLANLEKTLEDATYRIANAEELVSARMKGRFTEAIIQVNKYLDPNFESFDWTKLREQIITVTGDLPEEIKQNLDRHLVKVIQPVQEQNEHLLHIINLLIRTFADFGWLSTRDIQRPRPF